MRRGEVWWSSAPLPGGSRKRRPFVIVSHDAFNGNERYPKVMVVHVTSVRRRGGPFDWEVELPRGTAGLPRAGTVKCAEVYTIWKNRLEEICGTLPGDVVRRVDRALAVALALPV